MAIRKIFLLFLVCSFIFLCGCWDYKEYEDLALVSAVGFDTDNAASQVTVTIQYLVPAGSSNSQTTGGGSKSSTGTIVVKATGLSIDDAFAKIQQITDKKLFFGYMQEIVIGDTAAKQITKDIIGYISRTPNIRNSAYIAIAPGKAEEILNTVNPNVTEPLAKNIHDLIDQSLNSGAAYPVTIQDFWENIAISGEEPVAPGITVENMKDSNNNSSASNTSSGSSSGNSDNSEADPVTLEPKQGYFKIDRIAAFEGSKLVGGLTGKECTGLGWITNQKYYAYEIVKTSPEPKAMDTLIFRVTNSNCNIKIQLEANKPVVNINAYAEADLRKFSNNINVNGLTPQVVSMMEKELAENIRIDMDAAISKGQKELKTDIFQIGFNFSRQYPQLWHGQYEKQWKSIFPTVKINVYVTAKVIDTGTSAKKFSIS